MKLFAVLPVKFCPAMFAARAVPFFKIQTVILSVVVPEPKVLFTLIVVALL